MKIVVLMGGVSPEREVSLTTGAAVHAACRELGYEASQLVLSADPLDLVDRLRAADLVFNALHGGQGENGVIQGFLESIGVPYTGSGPLASGICMDKNLSKQLVRLIGLDTPDWELLNGLRTAPLNHWHEYPLVVKPNDLGSTIGLTIVRQATELQPALELAQRYSPNVLIEQFISGRELTVAILEDEVLPVVEIRPSHGLYDYDCKYTSGLSDYFCPADIPEQTGRDLQSAALRIFRELQCSHYSRIDFRLDESGRFWFLEANTLPGMTSTSLVPKAAKAAGISFNELVKRIIQHARAD
ncbi:MAG: D-alanine--D-alanine ligase [Candidatus Neomarinimicrobiota bacterium]